MSKFFLVLWIIFALFGLLIVFTPSLIKKIMNWLLEKELFLIMGILEIALGLGTLYYRHDTKLTWFALIVGLAFFIEGIFYFISSHRVKESYEMFLGLENKYFKIYGLFMLLISLGYLFMGLVKG